MINFLTAEFNKLLKRRNFYLSLAFVILASLANIAVFLMANTTIEAIKSANLQTIMLRFISNKFVAIIIVFITTVFIADTTGNTIKNAITIGYSRTEIYFSKIILGAVVLLILVLSSMISTFMFAGIWLYKEFTISVFWEALSRFSLLLLCYLTLYIIALTLCYIINNNMLFTIIYFILFLVFTEIIETTSTINVSMEFLANITLPHQLNRIVYSKDFTIWPYIVGSFILYSIPCMVLGVFVVNRKDIR